MLKEKTDEELMVAYQLGSEEAFQILYGRYSTRVYGFLKSKIQNHALAKDIFQSTFLKLHKSRSKYNSSFPFVAWLFTICRSELIDALRRIKQNKEDSVEVLPENSQILVTEPESINTSTLSMKQKEALELRFSQDFSFEEIAALLETTPINVRQMISRAIRLLRSSHGKK